MQPVDPRIDPQLVPPGSRAIVIAEHQPQYTPVPCVRTPDCQVITRWQFTDEERAAIVRGEDLFLTILSSGPINPVILTVGPVDWRRR